MLEYRYLRESAQLHENSELIRCSPKQNAFVSSPFIGNISLRLPGCSLLPDAPRFFAVEQLRMIDADHADCCDFRFMLNHKLISPQASRFGNRGTREMQQMASKNDIGDCCPF